ncbi:nicotinate (nicotinamide) nucleotide adenylyltransferase [Gloeobacter violaceus]|uniref:Probable nicotinate-nucleotide adenylyltransferase n=1 Tax=Gloeobacter violaceus (strain ATCC 29082 / PCC 7421) TaxID=251221 RepID=NADD_GLOVI|nr:nicotinate (nicotinamide) nucleotide adenylyltransferase [Gloeobacter violaceus]Q7NE64.1 RecName: Full=Probable nicotinate-nucleotide adenylyltransferase; AltName: Full=Deamido-NAD(+) diphosphorylase; AltName: Full=Deamido-NAD(+) pyrophosphorylase; AltName: Full=Nicotinate mononucleotide adenylyltransferase; Short=NaMN adenylyltransferase [Gloeobacter violaceus PCC 7421]BAC91957.1 glr4016 [Gloeobacter violaceus PCC 7421]
MGERLGIFGGTFNPVHRGHLAMARAARDRCGLDQILWVPAAQPPHKPLAGGASIGDRVEMVRLAIAGEAGMALSLVDARRPGPSYAIDTLRLLEEQYPQAQWHWLLGQDGLADLPGWYRAAELIPRCRWIVVPRPGSGADPKQAMADLTERFGAVFVPLSDFECDISSTRVREQLAAGRAGWEALLPEQVVSYIHKRGLYDVPAGA